MVAFERTDVEFHLALAKIGNSPVFAALHGAISGWLALQRQVALRAEGVTERALESHQQIHDAVAAHKPNEAWQAMDRHLRQVKEHREEGKGAGS